MNQARVPTFFAHHGIAASHGTKWETRCYVIKISRSDNGHLRAWPIELEMHKSKLDEQRSRGEVCPDLLAELCTVRPIGELDDVEAAECPHVSDEVSTTGQNAHPEKCPSREGRGKGVALCCVAEEEALDEDECGLGEKEDVESWLEEEPHGVEDCRWAR